MHHLTNPADTLAALARRLAPAGRLLIVMLPATISYPLFPAALQRFEQLQPDPRLIAGYCAGAGLTVSLRYPDYLLRIDREHYLGMVRSRYMSVLSTFDDAEIEAGVEWLRHAFPAGELVFPDRFAFIMGVKDVADE